LKIRLKRKSRKGGIGSVFVAAIITCVLAAIFYSTMLLNIDTMKYENMSQYARDAMLIMETKGVIDQDYLVNKVKQGAQSKLDMKAGETFNVYVKVGNGTKYNVTSMPSTITSDFGDNLEIELVYNYKKSVFNSINAIIYNKTYESGVMRVDLNTISKNRRTSDG